MSSDQGDPGVGTPESTRQDDEHRREVLWCPTCQHYHQGEAFGFICIGCACEKRPPFRKLAL